MITYMYKIAFKSALRDVGLAAALGVVNVLVILVAVVVYLRTVRWREDGGLSPPRGRWRAAGRRRARSRWSLLSPYLVMLLTALKPAGELRITPPRLLPVALAARQLPRRCSATRLPGLAHASRWWWRVASTALVVLAAVPAAYYTARHRFPGRSAFLLLVLVTQMFSPTALVVGLYREFFELGLVNTYAALILTNAAFNLAFAIWILRAFFASIPREIEEAAAVDGCGRLRHAGAASCCRSSLPGIVDRGDLRLHRRLERVHRRAHPDDRPRAASR